MAKTKVNITIDDSLLAQIDEYCDKNLMNRSWFFSQCSLEKVNQQKMIDSLNMLALSVRKCAENGTIDEDTQKQINAFEMLASMFVKK